MEDISLLAIVLGVGLIILQVYWEIHMRTDDKYISKKSSEEVEYELEKKRDEGKLNIFYRFDLPIRKFIIKRTLLKIGAILLCIGIISKIIF